VSIKIPFSVEEGPNSLISDSLTTTTTTKSIFVQQPKEERGKGKLHRFPSLTGRRVRLLDEGFLCHNAVKF